MPGKVSEAFPPIESKASHRNFRCGAFFLFPPAACGRDWGGRLIFCEKMLLGGTGGPGALQTSSDGERRYRRGNFRLLRMGEGKTRAEISDFCGARSEGKRNANFRENLMLAGTGGPSALQTSPPVRSRSRVDTDPHAALRALLVGLRPPTPQSPEWLRSTPFDCVAIAPCCFAFRKAVLSHALAALTALYGAQSKP